MAMVVVLVINSGKELSSFVFHFAIIKNDCLPASIQSLVEDTVFPGKPIPCSLSIKLSKGRTSVVSRWLLELPEPRITTLRVVTVYHGNTGKLSAILMNSFGSWLGGRSGVRSCNGMVAPILIDSDQNLMIDCYINVLY